MTDKQRAFVAAFLSPRRPGGSPLLNATEAARRAGHRWPGKQGPALLRHPKVRPAIEAGFRGLLDRPPRLGDG